MVTEETPTPVPTVAPGDGVDNPPAAPLSEKARTATAVAAADPLDNLSAAPLSEEAEATTAAAVAVAPLASPVDNPMPLPASAVPEAAVVVADVTVVTAGTEQVKAAPGNPAPTGNRVPIPVEELSSGVFNALGDGVGLVITGFQTTTAAVGKKRQKTNHDKKAISAPKPARRGQKSAGKMGTIFSRGLAIIKGLTGCLISTAVCMGQVIRKGGQGAAAPKEAEPA